MDRGSQGSTEATLAVVVKLGQRTAHLLPQLSQMCLENTLPAQVCKLLLAQTYSLSYVSTLSVVSRLRATALQLNKILSTD